MMDQLFELGLAAFTPISQVIIYKTNFPHKDVMLLFPDPALGKPQKKLFFSGQSTKAFSPLPLGLVVKRTATITNLKKKTLKKVIFFVVENSLQAPPPSW